MIQAFENKSSQETASFLDTLAQLPSAAGWHTPSVRVSKPGEVSKSMEDIAKACMRVRRIHQSLAKKRDRTAENRKSLEDWLQQTTKFLEDVAGPAGVKQFVEGVRHGS